VASVQAWFVPAGVPDSYVIASSGDVFNSEATHPDVQTSTDADGRYVLGRLAIGRWFARATDGRAGPGWGVTTTDSAAESTLDLSLRERGSPLTVLAVHADGTPFRGWLLLAGNWREPWGAVPVATDASGRARFEALESGVARLTAMRPGTFRSAIFTVLIPRSEEVRIVVDGPSRMLSGRVVDPSGRPVAGAAVDARSFEETGFTASGVTDSGGEFEFSSPIGRLTLIANAEGFVRTDVDVAARDVAPITLILQRPARIHGVVRDASSGRAVAGVPVGHTSTEAGGIPAPITKTDAEGRYALEGVRPGGVVVVVCGEGWLAKDLEDVEPGRFDPYALEIRAGTDRVLDVDVVRAPRLEGVVVDAQHRPRASVSLSLRPTSGFGHRMIPTDRGTSDSEGRFSFSTLAPRTAYTVEAEDAERACGQASVFASEGETVHAVVTLTPPHAAPRDRLVVKVLGREDGRPIPTARVAIGDSAEVCVDSTGSVTIEDASVSDRILARADGYRAEEGFATRGLLVLRLRPSRSVRGIVTWPDETAAAEVQVTAHHPGGSDFTKTDSFGAFLLGNLPVASIGLEAMAWRDGVRWHATGEPATSDAGVRLRLAKDPGSATVGEVSVSLPGGEPVPVIAARLWRQGVGLGSTAVEGRLLLREDFVPQWIEFYPCFVGGRAVSGSRFAGPFTLESLSGASVRLPPPMRIAGLVLGPDGERVAGALVRASPVRPFHASEEFTSTHAAQRSSTEGTFVLEGLGDVDYRLEVSGPPQFAPVADLRARAGDSTIEIRLAPGGERWITVVDVADNPVPGQWVAASSRGESYVEGVTDSSGRARLRGLDPTATYELHVTTNGRQDLLPFEKTPWTPADTRVVLARSFAVTGRLVDCQGRPVRGLVWNESSIERGSVGTDTAGHFVIDGLPAGEVELGARVNGWTPAARHRVTVPAEDVTLVVDAGVRLRLRPEPRPVGRVEYTVDRLGGQPGDREQGEILGGEEIQIPGMPAGVPLVLYLHVAAGSQDLVGFASGAIASDSLVPIALTPSAKISGHFRCASRSGFYERGGLEARLGGLKLEGVSDEFGQFTIEGVPPGDWLLSGWAWIDGGLRKGEGRFQAGAKDVELDLK
jgi:hypothetical protein